MLKSYLSQVDATSERSNQRGVTMRTQPSAECTHPNPITISLNIDSSDVDVVYCGACERTIYRGPEGLWSLDEVKQRLGRQKNQRIAS